METTAMSESTRPCGARRIRRVAAIAVLAALAAVGAAAATGTSSPAHDAGVRWSSDPNGTLAASVTMPAGGVTPDGVRWS